MAVPRNLAALSRELESLLARREDEGDGEGALRERIDTGLAMVAKEFDAATATLHRLEPAGEFLCMVAFLGLPERIAAITKKIPVGKGMAGLCAQRREPVRVCNLQTDTSGTARPGARETNVAGAIVVPVFAVGDGKRLVGTLGIGKLGEYEYSEEEVGVLRACANALAAALTRLGVDGNY